MDGRTNVRECFIIGSGPSLLGLSDSERDYLNRHPRTLALNKYLLFWEIVGVWPRAAFLADHHFPAHRVFRKTLEKIDTTKRTRPQYFVSDYYKQLFASPCPDPAWRKAERGRLKREHGLSVPWSIHHPGLRYFHHEIWSGHDFFWAKSLEEKLFFWRSSLVTAINLASIIWPGTTIKLLGVDLGSPESFYEEELAKHPEFLDSTAAPAREQHRHFTMIDNGYGTVLTKMPEITAELATQGAELLCCNPKSALVTEGLCKTATVLPE